MTTTTTTYLSASQALTYNECPQKWHHTYRSRLESREPNVNFLAGALWGQLIQCSSDPASFADKGQSWDILAASEIRRQGFGEPELAPLGAAVRGYVEEFHRIYREFWGDGYPRLAYPEYYATRPLAPGWEGQGYVDGLDRHGPHIWEIKLTGENVRRPKAAWIFQAQFYMWLMAADYTPPYVILDVTVKPAARARKEEDTISFWLRRTAELREKVGPNTFQRFSVDRDTAFHPVPPGEVYRNYRACEQFGACEFWELCHAGAAATDTATLERLGLRVRPVREVAHV